MEEKELKKAGYFGLVMSFMFPIVGVILYFYNKKRVIDPIAYLVIAGISFFLRMCLVLCSIAF